LLLKSLTRACKFESKILSACLAFILILSSIIFPNPSSFSQAAKINSPKEKLQDYLSVEKTYEASENDKVVLMINGLDLKLDLKSEDGESNQIRFLLDASPLMTKAYPQTIKVKAYTKDANDKEEIISIINSTFFKRKQARKYKFVLDIPASFSSNDIMIDVYDADGMLKASFKQYIEKNSTQSSQDLVSADCPEEEFGDCHLQYILNSITYQAVPRKKRNTVITKENSGKYTVSLPLVRSKGSRVVNRINSQTDLVGSQIDISNFITREDLSALVASGELKGDEGEPGLTGSPGAPGSFSGGNAVINLLNLPARDDPPSSPQDGDIYNDSSSAICAYEALTSSWNKLSGIGSCVAGTDQAPVAFDFTDSSAQPSTLTNSSTLTITGFDNAPISITGQGSPEYSIDSGAFTSGAGTIYTGQTVQLRLTSNGTLGQAHTATLTIGSVSDNWTVTSLSCPENFAYIPGSAGLDSFGNANGDFAAGWCVSQYEMSPQGTALWTRDGANGWHYVTSSGAGKSITAKGGGDSFPITQITRNEAATACASDLTTKDGTVLTNGKLLTAYFWSNINQAIVDDGVNWSGGTPGSGNLSRGNSNSVAPLPGVTEGYDAVQPTGGTFYYTSDQGRAWRMGNGEESIYDIAGNVWEWFDDLHNNAGGATLDDIDGSTLAYEHDNPNGSANITVLPSENSTHDNTTNGVGRIYVNNSPLISGTTFAAIFGGNWNYTTYSGVFASSWYSYSPSASRYNYVGFRCIIPSQ
jgi:hypothetical protein